MYAAERSAMLLMSVLALFGLFIFLEFALKPELKSPGSTSCPLDIQVVHHCR